MSRAYIRVIYFINLHFVTKGQAKDCVVTRVNLITVSRVRRSNVEIKQSVVRIVSTTRIYVQLVRSVTHEGVTFNFSLLSRVVLPKL